MPQGEHRNLKYYRLVAGLSIAALAGAAKVSRDTVIKAEKGDQIQEVKAFNIIRTLNAILPADDKIDVDNPPITIYHP